MGTVDTAKDLMTFAAGPVTFGPLAALAWARKVLNDDNLNARRGWYAAGAGLFAIGWLIAFVVWAAPTVWRSWSASGDPNIYLVLLTATWLIAIVLVLLVLVHMRKLADYLNKSYHKESTPRLVKWLQKVPGLR